MKGRFAVPVALLATVAVPTAAQAKKHHGVHGQGISIQVSSNPVVTGTPLAISGQLRARDVSDRTVLLWHRIAGQPRFTIISRTTTNATGAYRFDRAEGIVRTNRNWYVTAATARSRTVHERVYAEVALAEPTSPRLTGHVVPFSGTVTPGDKHAGDRVFLQSQDGLNGDRWHSIDSARVAANGSYTIDHRFAHPGTKTVRVLLRGDRYNLRSASDPVSVDVEQAQKADFTINASAFSIDAGSAVNITGTLAAPDNASKVLTLVGRTAGEKKFHVLGTTMTDANGNYTFTDSPVHNTVYQVRTGTGRHTALLYEGVRDVVSVTPSETAGHVGDKVTFTGNVLPSKPGHVVYLERKGDDGYFHVVQIGRIQAGSTYTLTHTFGTTGDKVFRVLVPGGPYNARGVSAEVTIPVS